jgi:hypothetical protein
MAVTGKMTVDLYANPDPFIQGMKAAENSAKKSGEGIAGHISKINSKQIHHAMGGALKTIGVIGAIETGEQIMLATIKGMADGTVKGMADFGMVAAKAVTSVVKGIPVLGTFMDIGEEIGKWVAGIDELNSATEKSKQKFEGMEKVFSLLKVSGATGSAGVEKTMIANDQYGMTSDEITRQNVLSQMQKEDHAANAAYMEVSRKAARELADKQADSYGADLVMFKNEYALIDQVAKLEEQQLKKRNEANDDMLKNQDELNAKQQEDNDLLDWFNTTLDGIIDQENTRKEISKQMLVAQEELSKANMGVNEAGANLDAAQSNRTASATSVDTALGSIKIQGVTDFSKSKEIEKAQQALAAAQTTVTNTKAIADGIAKLVQINGGTT